VGYWQQKPKKEEEPKSAVRQAMRQQAIENRAYLQEIAAQIPYPKYRHEAKMQEFESALYLVLSDRFEDVPDPERAEVCRGKDIDQIRSSQIYRKLTKEVERVAKDLDATHLMAASEWVKKEGPAVRRRIAREAKFGEKSKSALKAAESLLDREMPKVSRNQGGAAVVLISDEHAALISKALGITQSVRELPPAIDITPDE